MLIKVLDRNLVRRFNSTIINSYNSMLKKKVMNYSQYENINKNVSSEMFYSLMAVLHEKLPCAKNYYRLRENFRNKDKKYQ